MLRTGYFEREVTIASTDEARQEYFAKALRGLGHQMHLLQDMAVPAHVRNNAHPIESALSQVGIHKFEPWAAANASTINAFAGTPVKPQVSFDIPQSNLSPVTQLFDTDQYTGANPATSLAWGLAEFTNANFFSDKTIFASHRFSTDYRHYFPYPRSSTTDLASYYPIISEECGIALPDSPHVELEQMFLYQLGGVGYGQTDAGPIVYAQDEYFPKHQTMITDYIRLVDATPELLEAP